MMGQYTLGESRSRPGRAKGLTGSKHSDNLNNLVIASVSLGAERTFILSPRLPSKSSKDAMDGVTEKDLAGRKNIKFK